MRYFLVVSALAALALPSALDLFQGQPAKTTVNARSSGMPNSVISRTKDGKVCKSILITGSRLGATPVCKTQKEWDDLAVQYRQTIERGQTTTFKWAPSSGGVGPQ